MMRGFSQISSVAVVLSLALGCATVPAKPPTKEALQDKAAAKGAQATYDRYKLDLDGNAMCGQEVRVGGQSTEKAPARYYFNNAPFEVDHLNTWANYVGSGFLICGSITTLTSTILSAAGEPISALYVLGGCSIPLYLCAIPFSVYSNWDMEEATADYNHKLKQKIFAGQAAESTTPAGPIPSTSNTDPNSAAQTAEPPVAETQPEKSGSAPFTY